jgi:hypothetical protein
MKVWSVLFLATALLVSATATADLVFLDDFENEDVVPSGNPEGWEIFGTPLLDRGTMHNSQYHSPTAAVWVAISWQSWGWGATTVSNESTRYDVFDDQAVMSCWMRSTNNLSAASIALTIYDEDGTQWRTADANLFQLTTSWTEYNTPLSNMVIEAAGSTPGLDYTNIVKFGFLAYTAGQSGDNMVHYDDFRVDAIPEPNTMVTVLTCAVLFLVRKMRRIT